MRAQMVTGALALALALGPGEYWGHDNGAVRADARGKSTASPGASKADPSLVLPAGSPEQAILEQLRADQPGKARSLADAALTAGAQDRAQWGRLLWLKAKALQGLDDAPAAERAWTALMKLDHPLSAWARLALGTSLLRHDAEAARTTLAPLLESSFGDQARARELHAIALARGERHAQAAPLLRQLVADTPTHLAAATVAMPLAELLAHRNTPRARLEALSLYRRVWTRAPTTAVGKLAQSRGADLLKQLAKPMRAQHAELPVEDMFALATAWARERRYGDAIDTLTALEARVQDEPQLLCKARLERSRALLRKRKRSQGAALLAEITKGCQDPDVIAWAHYYAGRALLRLNRPQDALKHYDALPKAAPEHRLADDGLYRGALAAADADDEAGMVTRLQDLVANHPEGDMRSDGLFLLAWRARKQGRHADAVRYLDQLLTVADKEQQEGIEGRAAYWRARSLASLKQQQRAIGAYEDVATRYPLTYYAQQALTQLRSQAPKRAQAVLSQWKTANTPAKASSDPLNASTGPSTAAFAGAVALLQVGEADRAERVLRTIGMLGKRAGKEALWLTAALYNATGAYAKASSLSRYRLRDFMGVPPNGASRKKWRIAYPNAFCPLIENAAKEAGVPATFVRAVAREESAFNPRAVSPARAYGLIQLMRPTAKEHAKRLGLPSHPAALKRPEVNLRIGAQFIRFLWTRYEKNPAVVPAAYNAGHGAAERWMRAKPHMPLDEWVENIPYGETRRYTRRVLQTYGIYHFLDNGTLPPLGKKLPI